MKKAKEKELVTTRYVAEYLSISYSLAKKLVATPDFPKITLSSSKRSKVYRIPVHEFHQYILDHMGKKIDIKPVDEPEDKTE